MANEQMKKGRVVEVIGPVVDVLFEEGHLPFIHNAVRITSEGFDVPDPLDIVAEVEQHMGEGRVRCVAMKPTEGLVRGMKAVDLGEPISVPVGRATLGRVLNVLGEPVDKLGDVKTEKRYPIHRPAPSLEDQSTTLEMFETGIKVVDLIEPYLKGGKIGLFGGAGVGKTVLIQELDPQRGVEAWRRFRVRGRGRAHARGQRPVARNAGVGSGGAGRLAEIALRPDLRADDGTARRASARRLDRV